MNFENPLEDLERLDQALRKFRPENADETVDVGLNVPENLLFVLEMMAKKEGIGRVDLYLSLMIARGVAQTTVALGQRDEDRSRGEGLLH